MTTMPDLAEKLERVLERRLDMRTVTRGDESLMSMSEEGWRAFFDMIETLAAAQRDRATLDDRVAEGICSSDTPSQPLYTAAQVEEAVAEAVQREREACARIAEKRSRFSEDQARDFIDTARFIAADIRARAEGRG